MLKKLKYIIILILISTIPQNILFAETPFFLDFKYILNESEAGKKAQVSLKKKIRKWP